MNDSMNDLPREKLREILLRYGQSLYTEPVRLEGLLRDLCGQHRKEIAVLVAAMEERVPAELMGSQNTTPVEILLTRLTRRLQDNRGLATQSAQWAVDSWALALGIISEVKNPPPQVPFPYKQENINPQPPVFPVELQQPVTQSKVGENTLRLQEANKRIKVAWITGIISGCINTIAAFLSSPYFFVDVVLVFGLAFGIYKKSRACAVIMLIYFVVSKLLTLTLLKNPGALLVSVIVSYIYFRGIQGTYEYHKINGKK